MVYKSFLLQYMIIHFILDIMMKLRQDFLKPLLNKQLIPQLLLKMLLMSYTIQNFNIHFLILNTQQL